ncbi:MAG: SDR family oxidoreductase [Oscillospiraceae bacterium]|nr:SDR family oxidoreductase [Oscillospiraceae bacterium]
MDLTGKKILITGVSRPMGIGATLAKRLSEAGAEVAIHGFSDYDLVMKHLTAMPSGTETLAKELNVTLITPSDLEIAGNAEKVVAEAVAKLGTLDGMILNHTNGDSVEIGNWTPEHIDPILNVNIRASMMMLQAFAAQVDTTKNSAVTLFTSGQYLGPMVDEIAYCVSKEALICLCRQASYLLADKNIRVNCINPGPVDTGYCFGEVHKAVAEMFPSGRWGMPDDTADLVQFLHSDYAKWITGQVIASEGGFNRYK